jgi:hypothetical protein
MQSADFFFRGQFGTDGRYGAKGMRGEKGFKGERGPSDGWAEPGEEGEWQNFFSFCISKLFGRFLLQVMRELMASLADPEIVDLKALLVTTA